MVCLSKKSSIRQRRQLERNKEKEKEKREGRMEKGGGRREKMATENINGAKGGTQKRLTTRTKRKAGKGPPPEGTTN